MASPGSSSSPPWAPPIAASSPRGGGPSPPGAPAGGGTKPLQRRGAAGRVGQLVRALEGDVVDFDAVVRGGVAARLEHQRVLHGRQHGAGLLQDRDRLHRVAVLAQRVEHVARRIDRVDRAVGADLDVVEVALGVEQRRRAVGAEGARVLDRVEHQLPRRVRRVLVEEARHLQDAAHPLGKVAERRHGLVRQPAAGGDVDRAVVVDPEAVGTDRDDAALVGGGVELAERGQALVDALHLAGPDVERRNRAGVAARLRDEPRDERDHRGVGRLGALERRAEALLEDVELAVGPDVEAARVVQAVGHDFVGPLAGALVLRVGQELAVLGVGVVDRGVDLALVGEDVVAEQQLLARDLVALAVGADADEAARRQLGGVLRGVVDRLAADVLEHVERAVLVEGEPVDLIEAAGVDLRHARRRLAVEARAALVLRDAQDARIALGIGQRAQLGDVGGAVGTDGHRGRHRLVLPVEEARVAGRGVLRRKRGEAVLAPRGRAGLVLGRFVHRTSPLMRAFRPGGSGRPCAHAAGPMSWTRAAGCAGRRVSASGSIGWSERPAIAMRRASVFC